ncbi:MAG TPA: AEC family transporter [bacterium]|nr:AEC family transporter [bacterium]
MFIKLFIRILAIFCMIAFGIIARKLNVIDKNSSSQMSRLVTSFFYPALIFTSLVNNFTPRTIVSNWMLPAGMFVIMFVGYLTGLFSARFIKFSSAEEKNQFMFQCTTNNYSFLPLPIILLLWGETGVAKLVFSTLGSEISVWTLGILALTGNRFRRDNLKNIISVPMMAIFSAIAVIIARELLQQAGHLPTAGSIYYEIGNSFFSVIEIFGKAAIPVAMFIAGSKMADLKSHHFMTLKQGYLVILRLLVIPLFAISLLYILPFSMETRIVLLVVATMPSAVSSVFLSEVYKSDTQFAASSVLTTHLFSLVTIPLWLSLFLR